MSKANNSQRTPPHVALFPSAGMDHLTPFLRLATMLASQNCVVTLVTAQPPVSAAESTYLSSFLASHAQIKGLEFQVLPFEPTNLTTDDPFFLQFEATRRSIADDLCIPNYIVLTTSARFFSLMANRPHLTLEKYAKFSGSDKSLEIPGLAPLPLSSIPPPLFNSDHLFTTLITSNATSLSKAKGILMNTFDGFDPETIAALNNGRVISNLPPVLPVGPFETYELKQGHHLPWLDDQPAESVLYVSFGSRTTMSKDQIRELGHGVERSGCRFLWVLKAKKVDKEELEELLGVSFLERTKNKGMVVKGWVNQEAILEHPAIGGFLSHCGWNSVMEVTRQGLPILAWPQHGDQKINAEVAEKAGLGLWIRQWGWGGGGGGGVRLVRGEEIGEKVIELMGDENLRAKARKVGEEARKAGDEGGSSKKVLQGVIEMLKPI
ncbi:unnamed protein product [Ilex paraguariensis]|uniref:Glycosyltransferase n=1 Tax=Ilex paraguariensis TaxID=185542 RepID=A0ABC8UYA2_9AQUA